MNKGILLKACLRVSVFFSVALLCEALPTPPPGTNPIRAELLRQRSCPEGLYPSASLCCLNCPAGEHQVSPCSSDRGSSVCSECPMGTFTEHSNHLRTCLTCTRCPPDHEEVQPCSPTNNTVCRCKSGYFCAHDQACEVCQRCRSCNDGETRVKSCTAHSNSECAKTSTPGTPMEALWWILGVLAISGAVFGIWVYKKRRPWLTCLPSLSPGQSQQGATRHGSLEIAQNAHNVLVEVPLLPSEEPRSNGSVNEDDPGLGSSSSETSLTVQLPNTYTSRPPPPACPVAVYRVRPRTPSPPSARNEDDSLLVPLNGEKSLKLCFEYFHVDMDSKVHKRFFRSLDLSDNAINDANNEDRVYELLDVWLQREGQEAKLHHLLQKLRDLDQNRTADSIVEKAIANGHYERGGISHPSYSGKSDE
ncbi:tumor necrosis factor receptor superfamily member 10B-like isoform X2 [Gadus macrocephalus]|uniref:tumor necrosis factor receptor superfamily member 10B-like isoform X2 n=1 Tax=Gadus macrocephalus TaxID=80720 RepID=UPI0028CB93AB|nr:tumor necrosis factor receptor superfamily member 10B-like isoform X2 [Gadus macrocephalus]